MVGSLSLPLPVEVNSAELILSVRIGEGVHACQRQIHRLFRPLLRWVLGVLAASLLFEAIKVFPGGGVNPSALSTNRPFLLHVCEQKDRGHQHHCSIADREADPASREQLRPNAIP